MLFQPPLIALQALVSQDDVAATTSTYGLIGNLALSFSVVCGGAVFQNSMNHQIDKLEMAGSLAPEVAKEFSGSMAAAKVLLVREIVDLGQRELVRKAFAESLRWLWVMCTCVSAVGMVVVIFVVRRSLSREHKETRTGIK